MSNEYSNDLTSQASSELLSEDSEGDDILDLSPTKTPISAATLRRRLEQHQQKILGSSISSSSSSSSALNSSLPQSQNDGIETSNPTTNTSAAATAAGMHHNNNPMNMDNVMTSEYFHRYLNDVAGSSDEEDEDNEYSLEDEDDEHHHENDSNFELNGIDDDYLDTISEEEEGVDYDNDDNDDEHFDRGISGSISGGEKLGHEHQHEHQHANVHKGSSYTRTYQQQPKQIPNLISENDTSLIEFDNEESVENLLDDSQDYIDHSNTHQNVDDHGSNNDDSHNDDSHNDDELSYDDSTSELHDSLTYIPTTTDNNTTTTANNNITDDKNITSATTNTSTTTNVRTPNSTSKLSFHSTTTTPTTTHGHNQSMTSPLSVRSTTSSTSHLTKRKTRDFEVNPVGDIIISSQSTDQNYLHNNHHDDHDLINDQDDNSVTIDEDCSYDDFDHDHDETTNNQDENDHDISFDTINTSEYEPRLDIKMMNNEKTVDHHDDNGDESNCDTVEEDDEEEEEEDHSKKEYDTSFSSYPPEIQSIMEKYENEKKFVSSTITTKRSVEERITTTSSTTTSSTTDKRTTTAEATSNYNTHPMSPQSQNTTTSQRPTPPPSTTRQHQGVRNVTLKPLSTTSALDNAIANGMSSAYSSSNVAKTPSSSKKPPRDMNTTILDPPTLSKSSSTTLPNFAVGTTNPVNSTPKTPRLTSPFSPKARRLRSTSATLSSVNSTPINTATNPVKSNHIKWSMTPSRKVSILVNITPNLNLPVSNLEEESSLCLYPNLAQQQLFSHNFLTGSNNADDSSSLSTFTSNLQNTAASPARSIKSSYSVTSQTSIFHKAPTQPSQEIILVNPKAFGQVIPTSITMETAKLVASLKNIQSEDWVRKYKFDEICWPQIQQLIGVTKNNTNDTIKDIGNAIVEDVKEGRGGRCVFGYGMKDSGRIESMFGFVAGNRSSTSRGGTQSSNSSVSGNDVTTNDEWKSDFLVDGSCHESIGKNLGLLGLIISNLMGTNNLNGGYDNGSIHEDGDQEVKQLKFTLSIIEIAGEDVLKDLLVNTTASSKTPISSPTKNSAFGRSSPSSKNLRSPSRRSSTEKSLKIRHPDTKGAIIQNVVEEEIKSLSDLEKLVKMAFHSKNVIKSRRINGGRGHIIATLKVYHPKSKEEEKKKFSIFHRKKEEDKYILIQLVDLACADTEQMDQPFSMGRTKVEMRRIQDRRTASIRKSMSALRGVLRGLIVNEAQKTNRNITYRECTLTKLVQRTLDYQGSRAVVMATVCPRQKSYERTLHTLNYMNRLLIKPTKTAESPFETRNDSEFASPFVGGQVRSPSGDNSVNSYASSVASEAIQTEFISSDVEGKKEFLKSLVTDPRQRLATLLTKSPNKNPSNAASDIPMKEITTIKEIDQDNPGDGEDFNTVLKDLDGLESEKDTSYDLDHDISFESSLVDKSYDRSNELQDFSINDSMAQNDNDERKEVMDLNPYTESSQDKSFDQVFEEVEEPESEMKDGGAEIEVVDSDGESLGLSEIEPKEDETQGQTQDQAQEQADGIESLTQVTNDEQKKKTYPSSQSNLPQEPSNERTPLANTHEDKFTDDSPRMATTKDAVKNKTMEESFDESQMSSENLSPNLSLAEKAKALVRESNALRNYSPYDGGKPNAMKSLENYREELEGSLRSLDSIEKGKPNKSETESNPKNKDMRNEEKIPNLFDGEMPSDLAYADSLGDSESDDESVDSDITKDDVLQQVDDRIMMQSDNLDKKLNELDKSIQSFIESTNEPELINDLTADKLQLDQSLNAQKSSEMERKVSQLTAQTEALQSYVHSTQNQLNKSRAAEREKLKVISELNQRMEATQEEIQALKASSDLTIDQIKHDHKEALEAEKRNLQRIGEEEARRMQQKLDEERISRQMGDQNYSKEVSELKAKLDESEQSNRAMMNRFQVMEEELISVRGKNKKDNEDMSHLSEMLNDRKNEVVNLENQLSEQKRTESSLRATLDEMDDAQESLRNELESLREDNRDLQQNLDREIEKAANSTEALENEVSMLKKTHDEKNEVNSQISNSLTDKSKQLETFKDQVSLLEKHLKESLDQKRDLEKRVNDLRDENSSLGQELLKKDESHKDAILKLSQQSKKAAADIDKYKQELKKELNTSSAERKALKSNLEKEIQLRLNSDKNAKNHSKLMQDALNDCQEQKADVMKALTTCRNELVNVEQDLFNEKTGRRENENLLNDKIRSLVESLNTCEAEKLDLCQRLDESKVQRSQSANKISSFAKKIESLEKSAKMMKEKLEKSEKEKLSLGTAINSMKGSEEELREALHREVERNNEAELELGQKTRLLEDALARHDDEKSRLVQQLNDANEELEAKADIISHETRARKNIEGRSAEQQEIYKKLQHNYNSMKRDSENLKANLEKADKVQSELIDSHRLEVEQLKDDLQNQIDETNKFQTGLEDANMLVDDLKAKLDKERLGRNEDLRENLEKQKCAQEDASKQRQLLVEKIDMLGRKGEQYQRKYEVECRKRKSMEEEYVQNLANLQMNEQSKSKKISELEHALAMMKNQIAELKERHAVELRNATEKNDELVASLKKRLADNLSIIDSQSEEIGSLQDEIKRLYQSLKQEIEGKIRSEKENAAEVKALEDSIASLKEEKQLLSKDMSLLNKNLDRKHDELLLEVKSKKQLKKERDNLRDITNQLEGDNSNLRKEVTSMKEKISSLSELIDSEKQLRNASEINLGRVKENHQKQISSYELSLSEQRETFRSQLQTKDDTIRNLTEECKENMQRSEGKILAMKNSLTEEIQNRDNQINVLKENAANESDRLKLEIDKLKRSLGSKVEKNNRLKEKIEKISFEYEEARSKARMDLDHTTSLNSELRKALESAKRDLESKTYDHQLQKESITKEADEKCTHLLERLSDLQSVNQSLVDHNEKLMRKCQDSTARLAEVEEKKNRIYQSLKDSEETVRNEMKEIQSAMELALAKKSKELSRERKSSSSTINKLETTIKELKFQLKSQNGDDLRDENKRLKDIITQLKERDRIDYANFDSNIDTLSSLGGSTNYIVLWKTEKEQRIKAEEFAAAMAARAKSGFEERDERIINLRMRVSSLEAERENNFARLASPSPLLLTKDTPTDIVALAGGEHDGNKLKQLTTNT